MISFALNVAFAVMCLCLILNLVRLFKGPGTPDRILAVDTMYINTIALILLFGIRLERAIFFEAALLIAMMGFVGTVALANYLLHGDIID
jgi:multicomponent K+:H+ antiporter subunit F